MRWASASSDEAAFEQALAQTIGQLEDQLGALRADLVVTFCSPHHADSYEHLPRQLAAAFEEALIVGCGAGGVIGGGVEIERRPGLTVCAAELPDVELTPLRLEAADLPSVTADRWQWEERLGVRRGAEPSFVLLPDPFTFQAETLVRGLDRVFPDTTKVGGLASGGRLPGTTPLFLDTYAHFGGLVGVALSGNVRVDSIVAQGCRPIGAPMFVTRCDRNVLLELDGRRPAAVLAELHETLDTSEQRLFRHSLFIGLAMRGQQETYRLGDFLIRNLLAMDTGSGAIQVGALLEERQIVQFHLRDAGTSAEELGGLLDTYRELGAQPSGGLLFSCVGRGELLYGEPNHDSRLFAERLGDPPLGGFFCNGEIGPVQGITHLHGYTSSFGLFRPDPGHGAD